MKKILFTLFYALFLHFSASAMCRNVSLQDAIFRSPVIVYAEISFEASEKEVYQTTVQIKVIESIKGKFSGNTTANWHFEGSGGERVVKKETIKGIFFLSKNAKNEWQIDGIGCYNHRLLLDDNNKIILNENTQRSTDAATAKRVTMSDFKEGVALYLKGINRKKEYKKSKNQTYQMLMIGNKKIKKS